MGDFVEIKCGDGWLFRLPGRWVFDLGAGGVSRKQGSADGPEGLVRNPVISGGGGFRAGGGDLSKGSVDMIGMDRGGATPGSTEPGGLGQEVEGARISRAGCARPSFHRTRLPVSGQQSTSRIFVIGARASMRPRRTATATKIIQSYGPRFRRVCASAGSTGRCQRAATPQAPG